ncbi:MAG: hypothetical protein E4G90_09540 [Gemmatimonadales bacterium]|nr:MAG: hypothetical protein E4G90_09540 [Gemmatimonadales bacterium]
MAKLTLSSDRELVRAVKQLGAESGTRLSPMVPRFIQAALGERDGCEKPGRLTREALGLASLPKDKHDRELIAEALAERLSK